jgi:hypothetical protein
MTIEADGSSRSSLWAMIAPVTPEPMITYLELDGNSTVERKSFCSSCQRSPSEISSD